MKKITIRVVLLVVGGFLAGNALWNVLKFDPIASVVIGGALLLLGLAT